MLPDESIDVDPIVQREMHEGEQVLWWAHADPRRCGGHKDAGALGWAVWIPLGSTFVLGLLAVIFFFVPPPLFKQSHLIPLLMVIIAIFLLLSLPKKFPRYLASRRAEQTLKRTLYAITNQRILVIIKTDHHGVNSYTFTKSEIGRIQKFEREEDGGGNIIFGPAHPSRGNIQPTAPAATFVGIADVRQVEGILLKTFKDGDTITGQGREASSP